MEEDEDDELEDEPVPDVLAVVPSSSSFTSHITPSAFAFMVGSSL